MENESTLKNLETILFITDRPLSTEKLAAVLERDESSVRDLISQLQNSYYESGRALQIVESGGGFQMATKPEHATYVRKLYRERMTVRLSVASLETLAIIAYRQPITRAEIESIRGVEVIAALETLVERGLIKVDGRKETVGRPLLYSITPEFLRFFGFNTLDDMPKLETLVEKKPEQPEENADDLSDEQAPSEPPVPDDQQPLPLDGIPPETTEGRSEENPAPSEDIQEGSSTETQEPDMGQEPAEHTGTQDAETGEPDQHKPEL